MTDQLMAKEPVCVTPGLRWDGFGLAKGWCPGCHNGIIHRIVCEVIDELGIEDRAIGIIGIGCCCSITRGTNVDTIWALHGRCLPVGTGIKRVNPDAVVFMIEGDGGLGAIGAAHFINTMLRGERLTAIYVNNSGYGRTGGQAAPTTLSGMRSTTTPYGRDPETTGFLFKGAEIAAIMEGTAYSARVSVHTPANYQRAKKAIKAAFQKQIDGIGFGLAEVLCNCPTNWQMTPVQTLKFMEEKVIPEFPLGEFKNVDSIDRSFDAELTKVGKI